MSGPRAILCFAVLLVLGCARSTLPRAPCQDAVEPNTLGTACGFYNPEDIAWARSAQALLSAEFLPGGGIVAFSAADHSANPRVLRLWPPADSLPPTLHSTAGDPDCPAPPASKASLHPHGLDVIERSSGSSRVALVSHGPPDTIQLFELVGVWPDISLTWSGCVTFPPGSTGNDVALGADGRIFASNWAPARSGLTGLYYLIKGNLGYWTGNVIAWEQTAGWKVVTGSEAALPNGLALSADERTLYLADAGRRRVALLDLSSGDLSSADPLPTRFVDLPGSPDNLSVSEDGKILTVILNRKGDRAAGCLGQDHDCRVGWTLIQADPVRLAARVLFEHDGKELNMATSAIAVGERVFIGSMAADRIGVWKIESGRSNR